MLPQLPSLNRFVYHMSRATKERQTEPSAVIQETDEMLRS